MIPSPIPLTDREKNVLQGAADGEKCIDTAERLGLSVGRIKTHRFSLAAKLGADNITQAVAMGLRRGLIQ